MTSVTALSVPAAEVVRRPVYCVIEHEHRSREVADSVRAGRFEYFGQQVELGTAPDWTGAELPADEEWRIAWSKFYDGLDLAHAFAETGDIGFLRTWERLVASWIRQVPVGWDSSDVAARRVQNWIYAWQRFAAARAFPGLAPGLDAAIARSVTEQAAFIRSNLTPARNHRTFELYTLFLVALALPGSDPDGTRLRRRDAGPPREPRVRLPLGRRPLRVLDSLPPPRTSVLSRRARERETIRPQLP